MKCSKMKCSVLLFYDLRNLCNYFLTFEQSVIQSGDIWVATTRNLIQMKNKMPFFSKCFKNKNQSKKDMPISKKVQLFRTSFREVFQLIKFLSSICSFIHSSIPLRWTGVYSQPGVRETDRRFRILAFKEPQLSSLVFLPSEPLFVCAAIEELLKMMQKIRVQ